MINSFLCGLFSKLGVFQYVQTVCLISIRRIKRHIESGRTVYSQMKSQFIRQCIANNESAGLFVLRSEICKSYMLLKIVEHNSILLSFPYL